MMIKSIAIYRNIVDFNAFLRHLYSQILPKFLDFPGVKGTNVTRLYEMNTQVKQDIQGVQIYIEVWYDSMEVIDQIFNTPEGHKILDSIYNVPSGDLSVFIGEERRIISKDQLLY